VVQPLDPFLVVAAAGLLGALGVVHALPVALVLVVFVLVARFGSFRLSWVVAPFVVVALVVGFARARRAVVRDEAAAAKALALVPHADRCWLSGEVVGMPLQRGVLRADVWVERIDCGGGVREAGLRTRLFDVPASVARGDRVEIVAQLAPSRRNRDPDLGDPRAAFARRGHALSGTALAVEIVAHGRGPPALLDRLRARLRARLERTLGPELAPLGRALVLGEEDLAPADDDAFRRSGLTHLLAVSGSHVALAVGGLVLVLTWSFARLPWLSRRIESARLAALVGVPCALAYEQIAGDSGSARRATAMAVVLLLVRVARRRPDALRALAWSILAMLAVDPLCPFDLSFALSLCATVGLLVLAEPIRAFLARGVPRWLATALATSVSASVACTPLVTSFAGSVPVLAVLANLVAVPVGELLALPLANLAAIAGGVPLVGRLAAGSLIALRGVARVAGAPSMPVLDLPPPTALELAVAFAALVAFAGLPRLRRVTVAVAVAALLLLEVRVRAVARPTAVLAVSVLDVGQGDSVLVDLPLGGAMLFDAGGEVGSAFDPGRNIVGPVLAARRRSALDVVVLSHPHPDHFLGLPAALSRVRPREFWDTGQGEAEGAGPAYAALLAGLRARKTPIRRPRELCGAHEISGALVEVLHPCPSPTPYVNANDNSFVVRIGFGGRHVLLVGDAEHEAEQALVARGVDLRAEFLKVGHHGSRTSSSPAFLAAVSPTWAAVSCGVRNRFGHPHPHALEHLLAARVRVHRTDREGTIRFVTDGVSSSLHTAVDP